MSSDSRATTENAAPQDVGVVRIIQEDIERGGPGLAHKSTQESDAADPWLPDGPLSREALLQIREMLIQDARRSVPVSYAIRRRVLTL